MSRFLFCYGSLKQSFAVQDELGIRHSLRFIEEAKMEGKLYDLGDYPALIAGKGTVHGEIFEILDDQVFAILDQYEGYDPKSPETSLYVRELTCCAERLVWVYVFQEDLRFAERLVGGLWPREST
ncbi:MAG: gamma-glutamylcyclotransferase family protein [Bacteroidota bacterium]